MRYTTTQAATLIGCSPKTFKTTLDSGLGSLTHPVRHVHEWAHLGPIDVVRGAVLRELQTWGFNLPEAIGALAGSLDQFLIAHVCTCETWPDLCALLAGTELYLHRTASSVFARVLYPESDFPSTRRAAVLTIDIGAVANQCASRTVFIANKESAQ